MTTWAQSGSRNKTWCKTAKENYFKHKQIIPNTLSLSQVVIEMKKISNHSSCVGETVLHNHNSICIFQAYLASAADPQTRVSTQTYVMHGI